MTNPITVSVTINASLPKVWDYFTNAMHIIQWYFASNDWHTPQATNNLTVGEKFNFRMEAKDGSFGFDFWGVYTNIVLHKKIEATMGDGRLMSIEFEGNDNTCTITEIFEAENENSRELQQQGWQAILNNFKLYAEKN